MSIIKSFSVGNGDMFYIKHGSSNFTIIDCNIDDENDSELSNKADIDEFDANVKKFIQEDAQCCYM